MATDAELAEESINLLTRSRAAMIRWLALEILITDDEVMMDETLASGLITLQDRLTDEMRAGARQ